MKFKFILSVLSLLLYFNFSAQQLNASWKQEVKKVSDCEYDLIFNVKIDHPWHMYSMKSAGEDGPNPTKITFKKTGEFELVGSTRESKPKEEFDKVFEMKVFYFEGQAKFTQRVKIKTDKAFQISGEYEYQVCTEEMCKFSPPGLTFKFDIPAGSTCAATSATSTVTPTFTVTTQSVTTTADCKCDTDAIIKLKSTTPVTTTAVTKTESKTEIKPAAESKSSESGDCSPWETFLSGLGYGFLAVIMPCIYSMIPLTVSFFMKSGKSKKQAIKNSVVYGLSIILIFNVLTLLIPLIFGPNALNNISTNTGVNIFFFLLFVIFALSFFGLFEITLPSSWANKLDAKADQGGVIGIFFMALTLVVVSFSCTGLFLSNLIEAVAVGGFICPLAGFTGFGLAIALPFMLFAFFPTLLKSLPKSGGWMTTFKVTVAFIELALAVKFLANADNVNEWGFVTREVFLCLWIGIFAMLTFYLLGMFRTSHDDPPAHLSVGRILWATLFLCFTIYMIPGLWGAPLKLISSFPPPHHYAESPDGVGYHGHSQTMNASSGNENTAALEKLKVTGPDGLRVFKNDYDAALKYSKLVNKPLFVDFTGNACVNCRLMESTVWVTKEVLPLLRDSVVIVSLYVDSKVDLPESEQKTVFWYGSDRKLETIGDKNAYLQTTKYKSTAQPQYVLLDLSENIMTDGTIGTEKDATKFAAWLRAGIKKYYAEKK